MRILFVASEVVPFAKTGGLADVAGALPKSLRQLGHEVAVVMPYYQSCKKSNAAATGLTVKFPINEKTVEGDIHRATLPGADVPVYFLANDGYYDRTGLYGTSQGDYQDNCERFVFLSRGTVEAVKALGAKFDIIHCHDWQSGLVPVYLKTLYKDDPAFDGTRTVFTIHNLAYQGVFWVWDMKLTGLDWSLFNWKQLEFYGKLNLMKGGLVFADALTTVSQRYAQEIQTPAFGCSLDGVLTERAKDLRGIINGIDYAVWDPAVDSLVPAKFSKENLRGKQVCKKFLQKKSGLPRTSVPLIGIISRLADQKGFDLIAQIVNELMEEDVQIVVLGTGDPRYETLFSDIGKRFPDKVAVNMTFDNQLAHEIEAGSDLFLMPSKYEPCGLNQLYSLRYGTVPVVRETGGLADTVVDATPAAIADGTATGFSFSEYSATALLATIRRALKLYENRRVWLKIVRNGMAQDWSWGRSAREYVELYESLLTKRS
ncbi:MAG: glycogen synthase GlgA [Planctomycetes bacterium]|nr:glycogen synthase GlgA [Planctomycetota bacterium]